MSRERDKWYIECYTAKAVGREQYVRSFLDAWLAYPDKRFRPSHFDRGEPVRKSLAEQGVDLLVDYWVHPQPAPLIRRRKSPQMTFDVRWRPDPMADSRPFPWGCSVWISKAIGASPVDEFFRFLLDWFDPGYAFATTWFEVRRKNKVHAPHYINGRYVGMAERVELDFQALDAPLPGLYWRTYLGCELVGRFGTQRLALLESDVGLSLGKGRLLCPYQSGDLVGTAKAIEAEDRILDVLGRDNFFRKELIEGEKQGQRLEGHKEEKLLKKIRDKGLL